MRPDHDILLMSIFTRRSDPGCKKCGSEKIRKSKQGVDVGNYSCKTRGKSENYIPSRTTEEKNFVPFTIEA